MTYLQKLLIPLALLVLSAIVFNSLYSLNVIAIGFSDLVQNILAKVVLMYSYLGLWLLSLLVLRDFRRDQKQGIDVPKYAMGLTIVAVTGPGLIVVLFIIPVSVVFWLDLTGLLKELVIFL